MKDEMKILLAMDADSNDMNRDYLNVKIKSMRHDPGNNKYTQRTQPIGNYMDLSENEYRQFLNSAALALDSIKQWLNDDVIANGVRYPYKLDQFKSTLTFKEKQMHFHLEVEENAATWLEDEFVPHK